MLAIHGPCGGGGGGPRLGLACPFAISQADRSEPRVSVLITALPSRRRRDTSVGLPDRVAQSWPVSETNISR